MAEGPTDRIYLLVERARTGDVAAMEELLVCCQPRLRRYADITCAHASDIEDAMQEALVVVYERLGMLRFSAAFFRWLFQIVRRECLRLARNARIARPERAVSEKTPDYQLQMEIQQALESLPQIYREAVLMRDFGDLSIKDIADRLGVPVNTIKVRLHRGRGMLREYLAH